jgi:AcrR family transcriptional regulator
MTLTREKIIDIGEDLILTKGYNAFSYQDISRELGMKNAAVHYYFPSKTNLGTSIVKTNIQRFEEMVDNMKTRKFDEWKQLDTFIKIYIKSNRERKLCLLGSLGPDFETLDVTTQKELEKMTGIILDWLSNLLQSGKIKGQFFFKGDPKNKAVLILCSLMASLQLSRILKRIDYKSLIQSLIEDLRTS